MSDDDAFLAAIRESPSDRTVRLVYADWLEERNDPRAELIRIEDEMRQLPVYSDRYWGLKPRRNELRKSLPEDWVRATGYDGRHPRPLFSHGVPDEVSARWRLIRELVEQWYGITVNDHQLEHPKSSIGLTERVERRLGCVLPISIREWVKINTALNRSWVEQFLEWNRSYSETIAPEQLRLFSEILTVVCRSKDLIQVDPPCYYAASRFGSSGISNLPDETRYEAGPVSEFALEHFLVRLPNQNYFGVATQKTPELMKSLRHHFGRPASVFSMRVHEGGGLIVRAQSIDGWDEGIRLVVHAAPSTDPTSIPPLIYKLAEQDRTATGLFTPEARNFLSARQT